MQKSGPSKAGVPKTGFTVAGGSGQRPEPDPIETLEPITPHCGTRLQQGQVITASPQQRLLEGYEHGLGTGDAVLDVKATQRAAPRRRAGTLDAVLKVRLTREEKAVFWAMANRARLTASALARRRLLGLKVLFEPHRAAVEHLRQACVRVQALAVKSAGVHDEDIAAILAAQREAIDCLSAPPPGDGSRKAAP